MKKILTTLAALLCAATSQAQIQSLDQINSTHKFLLQNANGYGYCVYNSALAYSDYYSSMYLTLGGATVDHPSGKAHEEFSDEIDPTNSNNLWNIQKQSDGSYYLYNVGQKLYASNEYTSSWGGWGGWGGNNQTYTTELDGWYLSSTAMAVEISEYATGVYTLRKYGSTSTTRYMCAAGWEEMAIANYLTSDPGSQWLLFDTDDENAIKITGITLSQTNLSLTAGNAYPISATITPSDATLKTLSWTSKDPDVATVKAGLITAVKAGTTTITAKAMDGSGKTATCKVTVTKAESEETIEQMGTIRYFTLNDGQLIAIPEKYIASREEQDGIISLTLTGDTTITISRGRLAAEDTTYQGDLPVFESFKFNNKFNDQLYTDADGVINDTINRIDLEVACIGKRLIPSFKVPEGASAWVDGVHQVSKKTSHRFDEDITYTLAYPKNYIYKVRKVSDAVYSNPDTQDTEDEWIETPVSLTADMFSTNAPSNYGEDPANLVDGSTSTFFHSTWGSGTYTKLAWSEGAVYGDGTSEWPYLQVDLPDNIYTLKFSYTTRDMGNYAPLGFIIQGSNDGENWDDVYTLDEKDNLPTGAGETYNSPVISLGNSYGKIRFQMTAASHKNYLVMSELNLWKLEQNPNYGKQDSTSAEPILISPAVYATTFVPFGRDYTVHVDYKTDHPTSEYAVPRIDINTFDGQPITSKTTYKYASFSLDGVGVWDDLKTDTIQIKGRGNTSWSESSTAKNPYRIKFTSKVKPFGLSKGKNWVLLANKQSGSMTTNAIAMKLADMVETEGCNHMLPVELYINGEYRGSYNFTEKVGFSNNSIEVDDEANAVMLELDSYYDEPYKFRDMYYNEYVNIKAPDFSDAETVTNLTQSQIEDKFNDLTYRLKYSDSEPAYDTKLDVNALVTFMFVNDLTRNQELKHPKSCFLFNEDIPADSVWKFGPVWDFDWAYGYDGAYTYFMSEAESDIFSGMTSSNVGYPFFSALISNSEVVKKAYYRLWTKFLNGDGMTQLLEYCDDLYDYANPSYKHNATKWSDGNAYATTTSNAKNWLTKRANYIYSHLTKYDLSDDVEDPDENADYGHPDKVDVASVMSKPVDVYSINGVRVKSQVPTCEALRGLMPGIYIVGGRKMAIR